MVRFATTSLLVLWAGTLSHLGALALQLGLPQASFTVGENVPVAWTRDTGDPLSFSIMQQNAKTSEVLSIFLVPNTAGATSGTALIPLRTPGTIAVAAIAQTNLDNLEQGVSPSLLSVATQVTVVQASSVSASSSFSTSSSTTSTFVQTTSSIPISKTTSSTDVVTSPSPTPSFSLSFPILPSSSQSIAETVQILTATQPFPSVSFDFPSASPSSKVAAANSGGILGSKKVTVAVVVIGGVVGVLLAILLFLHIQRRRARRRVQVWADTWDRRRSSMSPSTEEWQSSSAISSFSAGVSNVGTTISHIHTPTTTQSQTGQYPLVDTAQSENQSRVPPPISIPKTYLTPPSPHSGVPLTLPISSPNSSSVDSPGSSSASSPYSPYYSSSSPSTTYSPRMPSPYSPTTPRTPRRITKEQEVAMMEAQRKLLREERRSRLAAGQGNVGTVDRDSWSMILNEEPLPQYVSPASSVRHLQ